MKVSVHFACTFVFLLCLGTRGISRQIVFDSESREQDMMFLGRADTADTTVAPFVCREVGNYPVPGQECTNAYYSCGPDFTPVLSYCPGASVFEPATRLCTSSSSAPCKKPANSTTTTSTSTTIQQTTEERTTDNYEQPSTESTLSTAKSTSTATTIISTESTPFVCPGTNGAFPNPNNCRTFYLCSNGKAYLYDCPSNLVFNPATGNCDYVVNVAGSCGSAR